MGKRWAYYNEKDPSAAEWIRGLIKETVITDGEVDERDIRDVVPADLDGFGRCHFFAGIGVWDYALTQAGWPDDREVWTGSCPCQPFSAAGKGDGFADERHLWPAWFHLIEQCRPRVIFGEQVSSKDTLPWIDLVHADLEGALYTVGAADLCGPSVGAPHIRQRLYFVADALPAGRAERRSESGNQPSAGSGGIGENGRLDNSASQGFQERSGEPLSRKETRSVIERPSENDSQLGDTSMLGHSGSVATENRETSEQHKDAIPIKRAGGIGDLADADGGNSGTERLQRSGQHGQQSQDGGVGQLGNTLDAGLEGFGGNERNRYESGRFNTQSARPITETGPTNGFWRDAKWIYCRDGKWRPVGTVKSGTFAMADVSPDDLGYLCDTGVGSYTISPLIEKGKARVMRLRGYGNAIVAEVAVAFIKSYMESEEKVR